MSKVRTHTLALRSRATSVSELTQDRAVFVHYTTIRSVKGGPNGFKSLLEVRRFDPWFDRYHVCKIIADCAGSVYYRRDTGRTGTEGGIIRECANLN